MSALSSLAKRCIANQAKYAHLNAFISRADEAAVLSQVEGTASHGSNANAAPDALARQKSRDGVAVDREKALAGHLVAIKDNICTTDLPTTAASGMLKNFSSPYDATVVQQLRDAGAVVAGKTNMDEFGMGSHSTHSPFGAVQRNALPNNMQNGQPNDVGEAFSAGGSSGGSAVAVASGQCSAALGTDTGGSVRLPAAYCGVVGFKPSYGLLSRWGVIAYANSLDTVGILGKEVKIVRSVFDVLNRWDEKDPTSLLPSTRARLPVPKKATGNARSLRIGIPQEYNITTLSPSVRRSWLHALRLLTSPTSSTQQSHTLHSVSLPATPHALSAYYILAPAEASSNLAKYDGVRFGTRAPGIDGTPSSTLFAKTRGAGFGPEVQRRILLGAFSLSADAMDNYFLQAQKIRRLVQRDFDAVFTAPNPLLDSDSSTPAPVSGSEGVDIIIVPTAPTPAPSLSSLESQDPVNAYMNDVFTVPASLAGLPAISVPVPDSETREPLGIQVLGQFGDDARVLEVAEELERRVRGDLKMRARGG